VVKICFSSRPALSVVEGPGAFARETIEGLPICHIRNRGSVPFVFGFCSCAAHPAKARSGSIPNRPEAVSKSVAQCNFEFSPRALTVPAFLAFVGQGRIASPPTTLA
jgi:hypothetical protein